MDGRFGRSGVSEEGCFILSFSNSSSEDSASALPLFECPKIVLWKQIGGILCDQDENVSLAHYFLNLFPKVIDEHFKKPGISMFPKEFLLKLEEFLLLLHTFLPNGQLLFANSQLIKYLKKETDTLLLSK